MTDLPGIWLGLAVFLSGVVLMLAGAKWAGLQQQERSTTGINFAKTICSRGASIHTNTYCTTEAKLFTLGAHAQRGLQYSFCVCVCVSVCVSTTILGLQATRRLMSDTNSFSATRARK